MRWRCQKLKKIFSESGSGSEPEARTNLFGRLRYVDGLFSPLRISNTESSQLHFHSLESRFCPRNTLFCKFHFSLSQTDNMKATLYCKFHFSLSQTDNMKATLFCKFHFSLSQTDNMKATLFYKFPCALWSKLSQALDINHFVSSSLNLLLTACFKWRFPGF